MTAQAIFKTRFCPSPTGLMHLGNLRTALFNDLLAKSFFANHNALSSFLLRIEDTDMARSSMDFTAKLIHDLRWLGLHWHEGPEQPGGHGPYFQAQRVEIYEQYYQQLISKKQAYWCYCTDTELTIARKNQLNAGLPPRYAGTCRNLTQEQIQARKDKGLTPALRFRIPDNEEIHFDDFIQGSKSFSTNDIGDFIIKKADGSSSFMFCNAVDDALMKVTHVMRGEDHLTNTPRQLLILKALNFSAPLYGHMPLILGFDGKPLSKRNGSQSVEALREQGYFPLAIINYLSRLGHHFEIEALLSLEDLGRHFSLSHVGRSPARFDLAQLKHWQKETVLTLSDEECWGWIEGSLKTFHLDKAKAHLFTQTVKQNIVLPEDALAWAQQLLLDDIEYDEDAKSHLSDIQFLDSLQSAIEEEGENYQAVVNKLINLTGKKGKALFMPLRACMTGRCYGPELAKIFLLMGKTLLLSRVKQAKNIRTS